MTRSRPAPGAATAGFTMLEAVIATAMMAMILAALATITRQWLPNWNRGVVRVQGGEQIARGLERLSGDLSVAEFISARAGTKRPFFDGTENSVVFVRTALGPNAGVGLDIVRIAEVATDSGPVLLRTRSAFVPNNQRIAVAASQASADPVVLLRMPYRVVFAYAGPNRVWQPTWRSPGQLPAAVRFTIQNAITMTSFTAAVSVHASLPAECVTAKSTAECLSSPDEPPVEPPKPL